MQTEVVTVGRVTIARMERHGSAGALGDGDGEGTFCAPAGTPAAMARDMAQAAIASFIVATVCPICEGAQPSEKIIRSAAVRFWAARLSSGCMLEIGLIILSVVCFVILDLYVTGCEKI